MGYTVGDVHSVEGSQARDTDERAAQANLGETRVGNWTEERAGELGPLKPISRAGNNGA